MDFTQAAKLLHDREAPGELLDEWTELTAAPKSEVRRGESKALLLRAGEEWLALPGRLLREALIAGPVHRTPYLSGEVFLGLTNVGGELWPCMSLAALVGAVQPEGSDQAIQPRRLLAVIVDSGRYALLADEARGVSPYDPARLEPPPDTVRLGPNRLVAGMALLEGRLAGLLDDDALSRALAEALRGRRHA
ncbi:chemotaxis protein CheW [Fundidesulfovibrio butyratiphilus]